MDQTQGNQSLITALGNSYHAQLALSTICTVAVVVRAIWLRQKNPYILAAIASTVFFFQAVLLHNGSRSNVSYIFGYYFLSAIVAPLLWCNAFHVMHSYLETEKPATRSFFTKKSACISLAYLWAFIIFIAAIAVAAQLHQMVYSTGDTVTIEYSSATMNIDNTVLFTAHGLWAYLVFFLLQLYIMDWRTIRQFIKSFSAYVFFLVIVNIGHSLNPLAINMTDHPENQQLGVLMASYFLSCFFGIFALVDVLVFGHSWYSGHIKESDVTNTKNSDEEQQTEN